MDGPWGGGEGSKLPLLEGAKGRAALSTSGLLALSYLQNHTEARTHTTCG